jgi:lactonase family protein with 7-bladed beta-propeller/IPT/TIG domain-containing protein
MRYQRLTDCFVRRVTENRAKWRHNTWHLRLYLTLPLGALLALAGCGAGSTPPGGGTPPPPNSVPTISAISPANATAGGATFTITVSGSGFVSGSVVTWNGTNLSTTLSGVELTADVTAADIAAAGAAQLTVVTAPGGGTSNPVAFLINGTAAAGVPGFLYVASIEGGQPTPFPGIVNGFSVDPNTGALTAIPGSPFQTTSGPVSLTSDPLGKFLYVASNIDNLVPAPDISAYTINPATGVLTPILGSPFVSGLALSSVVVDSTGKFLYTAETGVSNSGTDFDSISEFSIDATGALTPFSQTGCVIAGASLLGDGSARAVVASPAGFIFTVNDAVLTSACSYSISTGGALQPVAGSPFPLSIVPSDVPFALAIDPFGKFLYTVNQNSITGRVDISGMSISPGSGALTAIPGSPFFSQQVGGTGNSLAPDPLGRFIYILAGGNISGYSINPTNGVLSLLAGFPLTASQEIGSTSMAVDPSGKFLYIASSVSQPAIGSGPPVVYGYAINQTTGALTAIPSSPFSIGGIQPMALTITRKIP